MVGEKQKTPFLLKSLSEWSNFNAKYFWEVWFGLFLFSGLWDYLILFFDWVGVEEILGFLYFLPDPNFGELSQMTKSRGFPEETVPYHED